MFLANVLFNVSHSLQCRRILGGRNLVRVRNVVVAAIIISRDPDQASRFCGFLYHVFVGLKSLDVRYYFLSKA